MGVQCAISICSNPLSWHKYENAWSEDRNFIQRISSLHWSEQRRIKEIYDRSVQSNAGMAAAAKKKKLGGIGDETKDKRLALPLSLGLKQTGRSVKYMTATERDKAARVAKRVEERERRKEEEKMKKREESGGGGELSGEWERGHDFVCTVCCASYDELREVLHHKWDAHPFCLVAHVTLRHSIRLPPGDLIHPKMGRRLATSVQHEDEANSVCSKCESSVSEGGPAIYHAHVLECGGQDNWDHALTGGKSGKGKRKSKSGRAKKKNPEEVERAAELRKARFARFEKPPPSAAQTGRMTRLQANIIKEEVESARKGKKGRKKKVGRVPKSKVRPQNQEVRDEVVEEPAQLKSRRGLKRARRTMGDEDDYKAVRTGGSGDGGGLVRDEVLSEKEVVEEKEEEKQSASTGRPPRRRASIAAISVFEAEKIVAAASAGRRRKSVDVREAEAVCNGTDASKVKDVVVAKTAPVDKWVTAKDIEAAKKGDEQHELEMPRSPPQAKEGDGDSAEKKQQTLPKRPKKDTLAKPSERSSQDQTESPEQ